MKPNKITMQAFGPYAGLIEVDFDVFNNKGMFLITGPTGAGKTMIFDAIIYALYGQTSGSLRQSDQLRCDHALDDIVTYVELMFTISNKTYIVKRTPKYRIATRKSDKQPTALLTMPDGKIVEGVKEVTTSIESLLNIDAMQFKQIAMIAQGEFTKLIHASSDDRSKVLRKLFATYKYEMMEDEVRSKQKQYKDNFDALQNSKNTLLGDNAQEIISKEVLGIMQQDANEFQKKFENCMFEKEKQQLIVSNIQNNNSTLNQYSDLLEQQTLLDSKHDYFVEMEKQITSIKKVKDLQPLKQQIKETLELKESISKKIQLEKIQLDKDKETYNESLLKFGKISEIKVQVQEYEKVKVHLESIISRYAEFHQIKQDYEKVSQNYQVAFNNELETLENIKRMQERYNKDASRVETLVELMQKEKESENEYKDINQYKLKIHELSDQFDNFHKQEELSFICRERYMQVEKIYERANAQYIDTEKQYLHMQAGILASELKENEACPVCGSTAHPRLATNTSVIDKAMVEKAQKKLQIATTNMQNAHGELIAKKTEVEVLEDTLKRDAIMLGLDQELSKQVFIKTLSEVTKKEIRLKNEYETMVGEINYLKKLKSTMINTQSDIKILTEKQVKESIKKNDLYALLQQTTGNMHAYEDIKDVSITNIKAQYQDTNNKHKQLLQDVENITNNYHKNMKLCDEAKIRLEGSNEQAKLQEIILKEKQEALDKKMLELQINDELYNVVVDTIDALPKLEISLQQYQVDIKTNVERIRILEKQIKGVVYQDVEKEQLKLGKLNEQLEVLIEQRTQIQGKIIAMQEVLLKIEKIEEDLIEVEKKYIMYNDLLDMITGKNEYKLSFERYVLAAYFENILLYANVLLAKMTQGRYQLYRRTTRAKGNAKQGLDLDVYDIESGIYRDVKTLSGGESFKASLALALGLSNMIQSYAGGISLQTIFIDEGFGTLDNDSLDQAIECLMDSQGKEKLIGLISHVSELKQRIDNKIIIQRSHRKSSITIETM